MYYHDAGGKLCRIFVQWTSLAQVDAFVQLSAGRSALRLSDLLQLVDVIARIKAATRSARRKQRERVVSTE